MPVYIHKRVYILTFIININRKRAKKGAIMGLEI